MSWFIKTVGTADAVKAEVEKNSTLSPKLKDALLEILSEPGYILADPEAFLIEGSGHSGTGSSITSLKVERMKLAKGV